MTADVLKPGTILGETYRIVRTLGEGGAGTVYEALHQKLGHHVAIKVLFAHLARSKDVRSRFVEEAQIQAQLRHPNLVAVVDIIDDGEGLVASVMEFVEGRSLGDYIARNQPVDQEEGLSLAKGLLAGLAFAHERGVVHRDVKPDNVLLDLSSGEPQPRLTDFGIAKLLLADKRTQTGTKMGTVRYMAPEQAEDSSHVDERADIYALGVTLYELFTGEVPFKSDNIFALLDMHRNGLVPKPTSRREDLALGLERAILRALEKEPDDRFQSCQEMLDALATVDLSAPPALPPIALGLGVGGSVDPDGVPPPSLDELADTYPHPSVGPPPVGQSEPDDEPPQLAMPSAPRRTSGAVRRTSAALRDVSSPAGRRSQTASHSMSTPAPPPLGARPPTWTQRVWRWGWVLLVVLTLYQLFPFGQCIWEVGEVYRQVRANDDTLNLETLQRLDRRSAEAVGRADGFGSALSVGGGACLDRAGFGAGHPAWINGLLALSLLALFSVKVVERQARQPRQPRDRPDDAPAESTRSTGERRRRREPARQTRPPISVMPDGPRRRDTSRFLLRLDGAKQLAPERDAYLTLTAQSIERSELKAVRVQARVETARGNTIDVWGSPRPVTTLLTGLSASGDGGTLPFVVGWDDVRQALSRSGVGPEQVAALVVHVSFRGKGLTYRCKVG